MQLSAAVVSTAVVLGIVLVTGYALGESESGALAPPQLKGPALGGASKPESSGSALRAPGVPQHVPR